MFRCNFDTKYLPVKFTDFMTDCFDTWSKFTKEQQDSRDQLIWNNKHILIGGHSFYYEDFSKIGINSVSDLFLDDKPIPWERVSNDRLSLIQKLRWFGIISSIPAYG